jgi:hypothetical protein
VNTIANIPNLGPTHVTALCIPHCLDDRLSLMTRFCELTFHNDGMSPAWHKSHSTNGCRLL